MGNKFTIVRQMKTQVHKMVLRVGVLFCIIASTLGAVYPRPDAAGDTYEGIDAAIERGGNRSGAKAFFTEVEKAADTGDAKSQFMLWLLQTRKANAKDTNPAERDRLQKAAAKNLVQSANQKYPLAESILGGQMLTPNGVGAIRMNVKAGYAFVYEAATQGCSEGMGSLATVNEGNAALGFNPNKIEALKWRILKDRFSEEPVSAEIYVATLQPLSPQHVAEACKLAEAFSPKQVFKGTLELPRQRKVDYEHLKRLASKLYAVGFGVK